LVIGAMQALSGRVRTMNSFSRALATWEFRATAHLLSPREVGAAVRSHASRVRAATINRHAVDRIDHLSSSVQL
jgi:hypothetical protein